MSNKKSNRLSKEQIKYLSFEGGGGKGFAFLGALQALQSTEIGILKYQTSGHTPAPVKRAYFDGLDPQQVLSPQSIYGVSGASAGAITSLLISCGYSGADVGKIMAGYDFNRFFDPPLPRYRPYVDVTATDDYSGMTKVADFSDIERLLIRIFEKLNKLIFDSLEAAAITGAKTLMQTLLPPMITSISTLPTTLTRKALAVIPIGDIKPLYKDIKELEALVKKLNLNTAAFLKMILTNAMIALQVAGWKKKDELLTILGKNLHQYLAFMNEDMGIFSGIEARKLFAEMLAFKMPLKNGKPQYNATFKDHYEHFKIKLAITGTNLETSKSGLFSVDTTPNFPVADAVRISMSLPLIYKPYVIRKQHYASKGKNYLPDWVEGVWVDGGYFNNSPIRAFMSEETPEAKTLGLRLQLDEKIEINNLWDFFPGTYPLQLGFFGTGEAHINASEKNLYNTITLDTEGLDLVNFKPDPVKRDNAIALALEDTRAYFGIY